MTSDEKKLLWVRKSRSMHVVGAHVTRSDYRKSTGNTSFPSKGGHTDAATSDTTCDLDKFWISNLFRLCFQHVKKKKQVWISELTNYVARCLFNFTPRVSFTPRVKLRKAHKMTEKYRIRKIVTMLWSFSFMTGGSKRDNQIVNLKTS